MHFSFTVYYNNCGYLEPPICFYFLFQARGDVMPGFRILPARREAKAGWVVETTHDSGRVEISIIMASKAEAEAAADRWIHLDEEWAAIDGLKGASS